MSFWKCLGLAYLLDVLFGDSKQTDNKPCTQSYNSIREDELDDRYDSLLVRIDELENRIDDLEPDSDLYDDLYDEIELLYDEINEIDDERGYY